MYEMLQWNNWPPIDGINIATWSRLFYQIIYEASRQLQRLDEEVPDKNKHLKMGSKPTSALKIVFGAMTLGERGWPFSIYPASVFLLIRSFQAQTKPVFILWKSVPRSSTSFRNSATQRLTRPGSTAAAVLRSFLVN